MVGLVLRKMGVDTIKFSHPDLKIEFGRRKDKLHKSNRQYMKTLYFHQSLDAPHDSVAEYFLRVQKPGLLVAFADQPAARRDMLTCSPDATHLCGNADSRRFCKGSKTLDLENC